MTRLDAARAGVTAARVGLLACPTCTLVCRDLDQADRSTRRCPRCRTALHSRHPRSVQNTWALLIAATILYIPANVYPVMLVEQVGRETLSTILGGVVKLMESGQYVLALLVFVASVVVPLLKIGGLSLLLITIHRRSRWRPRDRTRLYRLIDFVGRWSMLDIFVIAALIAVVRLGSLVTILPEVGVIAFAAVVVLTMLAAKSFDPRLMWDALESNE